MESIRSTFIARQAILDSNLNTFGYELLYRDSLDNIFKSASPEKATSSVILQNHILGDLSNVCADKVAFINFDKTTILQKSALVFSPDTIVVELLETIELNDEVIFNISQLHKKGYLVALDDYDFSPKWDVLFPYISLIKIDIEDISLDQVQMLKTKLRIMKSKIKVICERVETQEQFHALKVMEVDYYQGYFFHKPEMKLGHCISPIELNLIQLFLEVYKPNLDFDRISEIITHDITLMSGVLKLVNGAAECANKEITSIKQAVTYLGADKVKQYIAIISMSTLSSESPSELFNESIIRAKMMEFIANTPAFSSVKEMAFITGILSNLGVILNVPIFELIENLPFPKEIKQALLHHQGKLHELLQLAIYFETPEDKSVDGILKKVKISKEELLGYYHEALKWSMTV
jgi:EAL and modified HD-GYP domain-containing signal transduction protein